MEMKGLSAYSAGYCDGKSGFDRTTVGLSGNDLVEYLKGFEAGVKDKREREGQRASSVD